MRPPHTLHISALGLTILCVFLAPAEEPKPREIGDEHWRKGTEPLNDAGLEQLARGVAYRGGTTRDEIMGDAKLADHLAKNGLKMVDAIGGGKKDMQAMLLEDTTTKQRYVVFRGTEPTKAADVGTDLGAAFSHEGVGASQYKENKEALKAWFDDKRNKDLIVTGHSLGGTHAQRVLADYPSKIKKVSVFNSPGVDVDTVNKTAGKIVPPITYYRNPNDPLERAGKHLRGEVYNVTGGSTSTLNKDSVWLAEHRGAMLQGNKDVKIEKTSFDVWQRGMLGRKASAEETQVRIKLDEQSDRMLREMNTLAKKIDRAHVARDADALKDLLGKYEKVNGELGELIKSALGQLPRDDADEIGQDKQIGDIHKRRSAIDKSTMVAEVRTKFREESGTQSPADAKEPAPDNQNPPDNSTGGAGAGTAVEGPASTQPQPASTPLDPKESGSGQTDPRENEVVSELSPPQVDPREEAIVSELKPTSVKSPTAGKSREKEPAEADLEALEAEAEADLQAAKAEELMKQLEAEGFNEAQAAAFAAQQAQVDAAQNMDDLLSAIAAALQDSGDWQPSGSGERSGGRRSSSGGKAKPAPSRKGVCDKPCKPAKKSR